MSQGLQSPAETKNIIKIFLVETVACFQKDEKHLTPSFDAEDFYHLQAKGCTQIKANIFVFIGEDVPCVPPVNSIDQKPDDC